MGERPPTGVRVRATGRVRVAPDTLTFQVAAVHRDVSVAEAMDGASRSMNAMVGLLAERGVAGPDARTRAVSVSSRTDERQRVVTHVAEQALMVRTRDLAGAGALIADVVAAGGDASRLGSVRFELDDDTEPRAAARDDAWTRATRIAQQHAQRCGRALGQVRSVTEGGTDGGTPVVRAAAFTTAGAHPPIEAGTEEITVTIDVEWQFAD